MMKKPEIVSLITFQAIYMVVMLLLNIAMIVIFMTHDKLFAAASTEFIKDESGVTWWILWNCLPFAFVMERMGCLKLLFMIYRRIKALREAEDQEGSVLAKD